MNDWEKRYSKSATDAWSHAASCSDRNPMPAAAIDNPQTREAWSAGITAHAETAAAHAAIAQAHALAGIASALDRIAAVLERQEESAGEQVPGERRSRGRRWNW